jgi:eukaryotic-like serine/threonine-protein kinase
MPAPRRPCATASPNRSAYAEAIAVEREAISAAEAQSHARMICGGHLYLALILADAGIPDEAEREARLAIESASAAPLLRPKALAALASIELAGGRVDAALAAAREAHEALEGSATIEEGESLVRLAYAEALHAAGHMAAAKDAIAVARERLLARATNIGDVEHGESFLTRVPENARTLEHWMAWTVDAS